MLYAQIVVGLAVEGPFDYFVPQPIEQKIKVGMRVWVDLGRKKTIGYVINLSRRTAVKNLKPVLEAIDKNPILDKNMLLLAKQLSKYYCCSWGEAIETTLPQELRKGRRIELTEASTPMIGLNRTYEGTFSKNEPLPLLVHDLSQHDRWQIYLASIAETLNQGRGVIIILADIHAVLSINTLLTEKFKNASLSVLFRQKDKETEEWVKIKSGAVNLVIGTRSSIFAPVNRLGLIILDEEENTVYKQEQSPHYHAREIALMRAVIEKAQLILSSGTPSLESFYLSQRGKIKYQLLPRRINYPEIKIINMRQSAFSKKGRDNILSGYLIDSLCATLGSSGKALLFLNRKGFSTFASCNNCGTALKCQRCNSNVVYHFEEASLNCHHCNYKMEPPKICPHCQAGYIKYSGLGIEKLESELARIFPQARICQLSEEEALDMNRADIFLATSLIFKLTRYPYFLPNEQEGKEMPVNFDLIGILGIDNSLNRIELRASEKVFSLLSGLVSLTQKRLVIQTAIQDHVVFSALLKNDSCLFFEEELKQRKLLKFPPYKHLANVKLRAKNAERVKEKSLVLFNQLRANTNIKGIEIVSLNPGQPSKLRGNFYWQILIKTNNPVRLTEFLKMSLKKFAHSGVIITVDIDPI